MDNLYLYYDPENEEQRQHNHRLVFKAIQSIGGTAAMVAAWSFYMETHVDYFIGAHDTTLAQKFGVETDDIREAKYIMYKLGITENPKSVKLNLDGLADFVNTYFAERKII